MANTVAAILTEARGLWKQAQDLIKTLDALQPPFTSRRDTRAALQQWASAEMLSVQLDEAVRLIHGECTSPAEYGGFQWEYLDDATPESLAQLQAARKHLRQQQQALAQAARAFNTRFGGYPVLLAAVPTGDDSLSQAERCEIFKGRPDVARVYTNLYGK